MLEWFHAHSNLQTGAIVLFVGLLVTTVVPYMVRRRFGLHPSEHFARGAEESFKLFSSLTLLLLAFCLVRMQGDHRSAEDFVEREGAVMVKLDRGYEAFGGDIGQKLRAGLKQYAQLVVSDEWPVLDGGGRSDKADLELTRLAAQSKDLSPETPAELVVRTEIIQSFNQMSDLREARIGAARLHLPDYYWYAIATALFFFTLFAWVLNPLPRMVAYVGGATCGLGLLLTLLITTSGIFVGESAVTPEPIEQAIAQFDRTPHLAPPPKPAAAAAPVPAMGAAPAAAAPAVTR